MPEVRLGLLGLGQMGRNHLRVLSTLRGADVVFVHDSDPDHARSVGAEHVVPAVDDVDATLQDVDALIICTPTSTHADYVARYTGRVKGLFVEKPLAHSLEAALALAKAVRDSGTLVQVGFIERFNPAIVALSRVLDRSKRVISIDFQRTNRLSARISDVDVVMDLMIHDIDLAIHLNGPVSFLSAHGVSESGSIDFASAQLTHANGRFSRLQASRITEKKSRLVQATCEDSFVDCDLLRREILIHRQSVTQQEQFGEYSIVSRQETVAVGQQEPLLSELQAFVALVNGTSAGTVPSLDDGIASLAVAEAIGSQIVGAAK